jgi:hypothetical protein
MKLYTAALSVARDRYKGIRCSALKLLRRADLRRNVVKRYVRFLLGLPVVLGALALAAPAGASSPRDFLGTPDPLPLGGYCSFPVLVTFTRANEYVIHESVAPDGTKTQQITGRLFATVTNEATGKSLTYNISGPGSLTSEPSGAFSGDLHGPSLLWTLPQNLPDGQNVPALSYTTGHVTFAVNPSGKTTAYSLNGRTTDVCAALAS